MELSIVLVIIGLLVGGILAGADLIRAAKISKIISEQEQIKTALNTFYLKYNCIPGDCYNISTYLSGETNGDGDELIEAPAAAASVGEAFTAWKQLSAAGLYPGSFTGIAGPSTLWHAIIGTNIPGSKAISKAGYCFHPGQTLSGNSSYWDGVYSNGVYFGKESSTYICEDAALKPADAFNIDKKIDDGIPGIGKVRSIHASIGSCATSGSAYNAPSASAYYITNDSIACSLRFMFDW